MWATRSEQIAKLLDESDVWVRDGDSRVISNAIGYGTVFVISMPNDFPAVPPTMTADGTPFTLPIIEHWSKAFELVDIVSDIEMFTYDLDGSGQIREATLRRSIDGAIIPSDATGRDQMAQTIRDRLFSDVSNEEVEEKRETVRRDVAELNNMIEQAEYVERGKSEEEKELRRMVCWCDNEVRVADLEKRRIKNELDEESMERRVEADNGKGAIQMTCRKRDDMNTSKKFAKAMEKVIRRRVSAQVWKQWLEEKISGI